MSNKYNSGKYKSGVTNQEIQVEENLQIQTRNYKSGNTNRNTQIGKIQIGEIQNGK